MSSQNVTAQQINAPNEITAGKVTTGDAQVNGSGAANQEFALNLLRQSASGQGPSAAQAQFRLNADEAAKRTMAAAAANQSANAPTMPAGELAVVARIVPGRRAARAAR